MINLTQIKATNLSSRTQDGDSQIPFQSKINKTENRLARDLFLRLMKVEPVERYNAVQALGHPWVSRDKHASIPITYFERYKNL